MGCGWSRISCGMIAGCGFALCSLLRALGFRARAIPAMKPVGRVKPMNEEPNAVGVRRWNASTVHPNCPKSVTHPFRFSDGATEQSSTCWICCQVQSTTFPQRQKSLDTFAPMLPAQDLRGQLFSWTVRKPEPPFRAYVVEPTQYDPSTHEEVFRVTSSHPSHQSSMHLQAIAIK